MKNTLGGACRRLLSCSALAASLGAARAEEPASRLDDTVITATRTPTPLEDVGSAQEPAGVRALHAEGIDRFDAVVGDLDAAGKGALILEDHPEGGLARSEHVRFTLPLVAGGGSVSSERVHDFGDVRRVEGVALAADGHAHFVIDNDGHVGLRTLVLE